MNAARTSAERLLPIRLDAGAARGRRRPPRHRAALAGSLNSATALLASERLAVLAARLDRSSR